MELGRLMKRESVSCEEEEEEEKRNEGALGVYGSLSK